MIEADFYDELAEGPESSSAYWMHTDDDVRVRVGVYDCESEGKGTILLLLGRFGYIERYGRVTKEFSQRGFSTVIIDWRSQGLSDRIAEPPL